MNIKQQAASLLTFILFAVFAGGMVGASILPTAPSDAAIAPKDNQTVLTPEWNESYAKAFPQCKNIDDKPDSEIANYVLVITIKNEAKVMHFDTAYTLIEDEWGPTLWTIGYCN